MKEKVVAIPTGRGSRCNRLGRGGRRKRRGSDRKRREVLCSSINTSSAIGWFQLGLQIVSFVTDIALSFFSLQFLAFWPFKRPKRRRLMTGNMKKKLTGSHPGLTGWTGSRVDRVSPGQFPSGFLPHPDRSQARVDPPGRSGF